MTQPEEPQGGPATLVCEHCGATLEDCAGCNREECDVATCYHCLIEQLGQAVVGVHAHGG
jgi:protein-arginine kinase activator protein McsA